MTRAPRWPGPTQLAAVGEEGSDSGGPKRVAVERGWEARVESTSWRTHSRKGVGGQPPCPTSCRPEERRLSQLDEVSRSELVVNVGHRGVGRRYAAFLDHAAMVVVGAQRRSRGTTGCRLAIA